MKATPELDLHLAVAETLRWFALPGVVFFHVPNGGRMTAQRGARLKRMGVKAGVADFIILLPEGRWRVLFLELKAPKGRLSEAQKAFSETVTHIDICAYSVANSLDQATATLRAFGAIRSVVVGRAA